MWSIIRLHSLHKDYPKLLIVYCSLFWVWMMNLNNSSSFESPYYEFPLSSVTTLNGQGNKTALCLEDHLARRSKKMRRDNIHKRCRRKTGAVKEMKTVVRVRRGTKVLKVLPKHRGQYLILALPSNHSRRDPLTSELFFLALNCRSWLILISENVTDLDQTVLGYNLSPCLKWGKKCSSFTLNTRKHVL